MLLTPEFFEQQGCEPELNNKHVLAYNYGNIFVRWTLASEFVLFDISIQNGGTLFEDYDNKMPYTVEEFKQLCNALRIPIKNNHGTEQTKNY